MIYVSGHLYYDFLDLEYLSLDVVTAEKPQERVHLFIPLHLLNENSDFLMHSTDRIVEVTVDRRVQHGERRLVSRIEKVKLKLQVL